MTKKAAISRSSARVVPLRKGTTIQMVRLACPDAAQCSLIAESFGLPVLDSDGIRELHEKLIVDTAAALDEGLGERAMQIHLQRIVGAYVGSAHGAGQFYSRSVTEARDATAKAACDDRDEDSADQLASTAPPSVSENSLPTWRFRPTRCAWPPRAPSMFTNRSSARSGSPSNGRWRTPGRADLQMAALG
jgi:hypothetical protein